MAEDRPQLYLVTPPSFDLDSFAPQLARILDAQDVACLRLHMATQDTDAILRAGDALRELAHARDIPLVIADHVLMVERLGLDGVHLTDPGSGIRKLRDTMGADAIIGAHCGNLRHDGMAAGEAGADYIAFGPVGETLFGRRGTCRTRIVRMVVRVDRGAGRGRRRADHGTGRKPCPGHGFSSPSARKNLGR